jgi:F-type H+-transporting ATPase subunit a
MKGSDCVGEHQSFLDIKVSLFGHEYGLSPNIVIQWAIILILAGISIYLTRRLKKIPDRRQSVAELLVESTSNFVKSTMGEEYVGFMPYVGTLVAFLLFKFVHA